MYNLPNAKSKICADCDRQSLLIVKDKLKAKRVTLSVFLDVTIGLLAQKPELIDIILGG